MNVSAEVIALDSSDIDDLVARYEPDQLYEVVERFRSDCRCARTRRASRPLAKAATLTAQRVMFAS